MISFIKTIITRDLQTLKKELNIGIKNHQLWKVYPGITNSIGNLTLHICGNLRHFIGNVIGNSGYQRDRDAEFTNNSATINELQSLIDKTIEEISTAMDKISKNSASEDYHVEIGGNRMKNNEAVIYLISHLGYHLGQVNYLRRIIQNDHND
jgi:uncharacterized damage-inducible protein DinB